MSATTVDMTGFEKGLSEFIGATRIKTAVVVKKECGELIKTLVKITPPATPETTRQSITNQVYMTMSALDHVTRQIAEHKHSGDGITYYAFDQNYLYGVASDKDMTSASVPELKKVFLSTKNSGGLARQIVDFNHPRKRQRVALAQRVMTTVRQRQKLIDYFWRHVGRLKAGWLVAVGDNIVTLKGANLPPRWVTRHQVGARGTAVDNTNVKDFPSITISNFAAGVGSKKNNLNWLVRGALKIRIKAMATNATLYMQGKKNLSDYAK